MIGNAIENLPPLTPLIDGVLYRDSTSILYGPPGKGKSFVMLDIACCVATGGAWHGHKVEQGPVLYIMGEGLTGTADRFRAWKHHAHVEAIDNLYWGPRAPNILDPQGQDEILECVRLIQPTLIILDTLARHIAGGDENEFKTMSTFVSLMDAIRLESNGGTSLAVHHTGKELINGARGHSSLKGAMDTEIFCGDGPILQCTKQKNGPDGHIIETFKLIPVLDSMILTSTKLRSTPNQQLMLMALSSCGGEATYTELRASALAAGLSGGSFDRVLREMVERVMVVTDGTDGRGGHKSYMFPFPGSDA